LFVYLITCSLSAAATATAATEGWSDDGSSPGCHTWPAAAAAAGVAVQ